MSQVVAHSAFLLGTLSHACLFAHGEWHMQSPTLFVLALGLPAFASCLVSIDSGISRAVQVTTAVSLRYLCGLFASMLVYRLFLHRLRVFPGPGLASLTKFWHMVKVMHGKNHVLLQSLHQEYGDFVRTGMSWPAQTFHKLELTPRLGPNELTCFNVEALAAVGDTTNQCTKSPWYDFLLPDQGLVTIRDRPFHDIRRRVWLRAFSRRRK